MLEAVNWDDHLFKTWDAIWLQYDSRNNSRPSPTLAKFLTATKLRSVNRDAFESGLSI